MHLNQGGNSEMAYLELLGLVVARINCVLAFTRVAQQLPAIDLDGVQCQRSVRVLHPFAVLPLHDAARACWVLRVRDRAVVGRFVVAILGERVRDAGARRLDELVVQRVEETLQGLSVSESR